MYQLLRVIKTMSCVIAVFYSYQLFAATFGEVAQNLYEPVSLIIDLVRTVSLLCGAGLILGGVFRFIEYRKNPVAVRLSMVIFMFIFGIALIILGIIHPNLF